MDECKPLVAGLRRVLEIKGLTICYEPISYVLVQVASVYKGQREVYF
jgi:hypothetical protein